MKKPISQDKLFEDCVKYLPAFPIVTPTSEGGHFLHWGMTLRDYFAAQALAGMDVPDDRKYSGFDWNLRKHARDAEYLAQSAYRIADAMLAERQK